MKKLPYNTTDKYTGIKFKENGISKDEGFNCLSMALDFCKEELDLDYDFDEKIIGDISWDNVVKLFHENPKEIFNELEKHFLNYCEIIPPHQMIKGDSLSVDFGDGIKVPCVFVGNNKVLVTTKKGVKVISLKGKKVIDVYRIKDPKKIITKAVYKMGENPKDFKLLEEESYLYDGDIAECDPGTWVAIISLIITLITSIWVYFNQPEITDTPQEEERGIQLNTRSTQEPVRVIYGLQRVGGNDVYISTMGYHNKELWIIQTLSEGECEGIYQDGGVDQILIDDEPYTDFGSTIDYQFYSGSSTQTYDTALNAVDSNWTDNQRYTSYIRWKFTWDENLYRGVPSRVLDFKGKKILDFRNSTTAWSQNAVLALYDFFTEEEYGLGVNSDYIDETSWTTAANYFDTKGWLFNYVVQGSKNSWAIAQDMMKHFRAAISWFDGKYYLLIADINEESSVMTIEDKHIVQDGEGRAQIRLVQPSRFDKPNGLRVTFNDKEKEYVKDDVLIGDESGVVDSISLMGYTDRKTACDLATYQLERLNLNRTISGTFRDDCLELAPHDLITFNSTALAISNQVMRVVSASFAGNGLINMSLQYESYDLYDDDYNADIEGIYTCNLPNPNTVVSIQNPQITEETYYYRLRTFSRLNITFTVSEDEPWFKHVEVWQATVDAGSAVPVQADYEHQFNSTNKFSIDPVEQDQEYYIVLIPVSIYGVKDTFNNAPKLSSLIIGNSSAPESLPYLFAVPSDNSLVLFSDKLDDPDIEVYEFRLGGTWNTGVFLSAKRSPQESLANVKPGEHSFSAESKGSNGEYGIDPEITTATMPLPIGWALSNTFTVDVNYTATVTLPNNITGITKANPGVVSSVAHGLQVGDRVYFNGLTQMTELNTTSQYVTAVGSVNLFSINNTSTYGAAETTGGACGWDRDIKDNVQKITYDSETYLKCSHTSGVLTGTFTSPGYDTGVAAQEYYVYVDATITVVGEGDGWDDVLPTGTTWNDINISTRTWNQIVDVESAPKVNITMLYREHNTNAWSEMKNAEILSASITARYFKVKIEIEDPSTEIHAYVENYSLKLHTKT